MLQLTRGYHGKEIRLIDIHGEEFVGHVSFFVRGIDDDERHRDSITMKLGDEYWCFYDDDIESIEILDEK